MQSLFLCKLFFKHARTYEQITAADPREQTLGNSRVVVAAISVVRLAIQSGCFDLSEIDNFGGFNLKAKHGARKASRNNLRWQRFTYRLSLEAREP